MGGPWGWFYVAVRTFPFWAIPLAFTLIAAALRAKKSKTGSKKGTTIYYLTALVLIVLSSLYLYFQGHQHAVPFFYNAINDKH